MPVFHTFTAGGKRYMFDANTNVIINLKEDLYFELEKYMQSGYKEITPAIEKLRDRGYLKDRADFEMVHPMDSTLEYSLERCIGTIALQVTQGCNLRCKSSTDFLIIFSNLRKCRKGLEYQAFPAFCVSEDTPHIMAFRSLTWR